MVKTRELLKKYRHAEHDHLYSQKMRDNCSEKTKKTVKENN